ncbi:MAG: hypothetical protein V3S17_04380, partial [candidate division Zixibacteria bacterium]
IRIIPDSDARVSPYSCMFSNVVMSVRVNCDVPFSELQLQSEHISKVSRMLIEKIVLTARIDISHDLVFVISGQ